ncbi:MAG: DUF2975 domain-containing protein [Clostridiales bacterium]|nr:DUF2975 domain-containing protein [Clostridiales bacterium]
MNNTQSSKYTIWLNLTLVACVVFFLCCLMGDIFAYPFCEHWWDAYLFNTAFAKIIPALEKSATRFNVFLTCFYLSTALTYPIIFCVVGLIRNIKKDKIFERANTRLMSIISLCCFLICVICTIGAIACYALAVIALVGLFVGLIVQCVRLVMDRAIDMRDELDLTV